jgi:poly(A) polymerase
MRDIWAMQPRFERRVGKSPYKLLEHPRLRAGYDFLLLRCASGEIDAEIGEWWTAFMEADGAGREALLAKKPRPEGAAPAPRKRRRRKSKGTGGEGHSVESSPAEPSAGGDGV